MDWPIRAELDHAEEYFVNDLDKCVEKFTELQKKHPNSPRALYVGTRARLERLFNSTLKRDDEEYKKELNSILDVYMSLMDRYVFDEETDKPEELDIMPTLFGSLAIHSSSIAEVHNLTARAIEFTEKAIEKAPKSYLKQHNYHVGIIHHNIIMGDWELAEKNIERALEHFENNFDLMVSSQKIPLIQLIIVQFPEKFEF